MRNFGNGQVFRGGSGSKRNGGLNVVGFQARGIGENLFDGIAISDAGENRVYFMLLRASNDTSTAGLMNSIVTVRTKSNQVGRMVTASAAAKSDVMNLKSTACATDLTPPAVPFKHHFL